MEKLQNNIGFLIFTALIFFGGMKFEQYRNDSNALDQEKKQQEIEIERAKASDEVAQKVLTGLTNWKKNTETIYKEMHYEKTKPVFYNVCASDEYVKLFNTRQEEAKRILKSKE